MRQELGWPIVMTPFAQMVITQAVMNVTGKERYAMIPDEVIRYALGRFGRPNVPIDAQVMERIESLPRTRELRAEPAMAPLAELRRRIGAHVDRRGIPAARDDAGAGWSTRCGRRPGAAPLRSGHEAGAGAAAQTARAARSRAGERGEAGLPPGIAAQRRRRMKRNTRRSAAARAAKLAGAPDDRRLHVRRRRHAAAQRPLARRLRSAARRHRDAERTARARHSVRAADQRQRLSTRASRRRSCATSDCRSTTRR